MIKIISIVLIFAVVGLIRLKCFEKELNDSWEIINGNK